MKKHLLSILAALCLAPVGCATFPAPTSKAAVAIDLQSIANGIRLAETTAMTPASFDALLTACAGAIPEAAPYIGGAELGYEALYAAGNLSIPALESLAHKFDS